MRIAIIVLCLFISTCFIALKASAQTPVVKTTQGYLRGVTENGISVFKGVPYAQPPVGDLRYMPPMEHKHWTDTLDALAFGAAATQPGGSKVMGNENSLFLNLYTPAIDKRKRPVVVWIHGGSMTNGWGSGMDGHAFADKDDIITITINYRLGALGFLYLGDVDTRYAQSGNLGLLDVVAALKWIHENIAAFGGDPAQVTLMGESAGGKLISAVMVAPASKGLYHQAVLESGAVQCIRDTTTARNERARLMKQLGISDARKLLTLSADTIIKAQGIICAGIGGNSQFGPVYDGVTITEDAYRYAASGKLSGVNVLIGTNEDEAAMFTSPDADYAHAYESIFTPLFQSNAPQAYAFYQRQLKTDTPYAAAVKTLTQYMYQMHSYRFAKVLAAHGTPIWMYRYKYRAGKAFGAKHSFELNYIWNTAKILSSSANAEEKQLAANMHTSWVNFIKTGNPQTSGLPQWPHYNSRTPQVMAFDTTDTVITLKEVYDDPTFPSSVFVIK
jgi:para-nitrobenzyl esterase